MIKLHTHVRRHGSYQLECKTYYPLSSGAKNRYLVSLYLFFPQSLNINRKQYSVPQVLQDCTTYTRFSSPSMTIGELLDVYNRQSPLQRIKKMLEKVREEKSYSLTDLEHECKTLVNAYRVAMRHKNKISIKTKDGVPWYTRITQYVDEVVCFLKEVRTVFSLVSQYIPESKTLLLWTDESISVIFVKYIGLLVRYEEKHFTQHPAKTLFQPMLFDNQQYGIEKGFVSSCADDARIQREYIYRCGELKKWSQSVLYLETQRRIRAVGSVHMVAGIAAAVGMTFSVIAALFATRFFPSYSSPWILVIIISYIFKDRIKEVLRNILLKMLPHVLSDRDNKLIDPTVKQKNKNIGHSRMTVEYLKIGQLPGHIKKAWRVFHHPLSDPERQEKVMYLKKNLLIEPQKILKQHSRVHGLTEIVRLKCQEWVKEMNDRADVHAFHDGSFIRKVIPKNYEVPLLLELRDERRKKIYIQRFRILLDYNGIIDIDRVTTNKEVNEDNSIESSTTV